MTRQGCPSNTRTIPRRICVAGIAIRSVQRKGVADERPVGSVVRLYTNSKMRQPLILAGRWGSVKLAQDGLERAPDVACNDLLALLVGVDTVALIEPRYTRDSFEEEWHHRHSGFPCNVL